MVKLQRLIKRNKNQYFEGNYIQMAQFNGCELLCLHIVIISLQMKKNASLSITMQFIIFLSKDF